MPRKSKNTLANERYGEDFEDLYGAEKAVITRAYNAQSTAKVAKKKSVTGTVKATIGRVGVNGTKTCLMTKNSTVEDLLDQSNYDFDSDKEGIVAESTGNEVALGDLVVNGEVYAITPSIASA